jgi:hypothetical protein
MPVKNRAAQPVHIDQQHRGAGRDDGARNQRIADDVVLAGRERLRVTGSIQPYRNGGSGSMQPDNAALGAGPGFWASPRTIVVFIFAARHDQGYRQRGCLLGRLERLDDHRVRRELCGRGSPPHSGPAIFAIVSVVVGVYLIVDGVTGIVGR